MSTTGSYSCVGSVSSFFLELFLHWSPVAYWAPIHMGMSSFSVLSFCLFYCSWGSQGKDTEVVRHFLLQWTTFCQNSPPWPIHLRWPYMAWLIVSLRQTRLWFMLSDCFKPCFMPWRIQNAEEFKIWYNIIQNSMRITGPNENHVSLVCVNVLSHWVISNSLWLPASSVHGIFQARILEWVVFITPWDLLDPGIEPTSLPPPALAGKIFTTEPPGKLCNLNPNQRKDLIEHNVKFLKDFCQHEYKI